MGPRWNEVQHIGCFGFPSDQGPMRRYRAESRIVSSLLNSVVLRPVCSFSVLMLIVELNQPVICLQVTAPVNTYPTICSIVFFLMFRGYTKFLQSSQCAIVCPTMYKGHRCPSQLVPSQFLAMHVWNCPCPIRNCDDLYVSSPTKSSHNRRSSVRLSVQLPVIKPSGLIRHQWWLLSSQDRYSRVRAPFPRWEITC